jgi:hypothetical protein
LKGLLFEKTRKICLKRILNNQIQESIKTTSKNLNKLNKKKACINCFKKFTDKSKNLIAKFCG